MLGIKQRLTSALIRDCSPPMPQGLLERQKNEMPLGNQGLEVLRDPIHLPGRCNQAAGFVVVPLGCLAEVGASEQGLGLRPACIHDHRLGMLIAAILGAFDQAAIHVSQGFGIPGPRFAAEPLADPG